MATFVCLVHQETTCHGGKQCGNGADDGKGKSHQGECCHNGVNSRLWCGNKERGYRTLGGAILAHGHGRWYNSAGAQGQRYAYECCIDNATEGFLGEKLVKVLPWYKGVHDTGYEETQ